MMQYLFGIFRLVSILLGLPLLVYSRLEDKEYIHFVSYRMCLEEWPSSTARTIYASIIMLLQFVIPVIILIIVHWRICNFLKTRILQVIILSTFRIHVIQLLSYHMPFHCRRLSVWHAIRYIYIYNISHMILNLITSEAIDHFYSIRNKV